MTMRTAALVLYLDGFCYQSYGWQMLRPLGEVQTVFSMLDDHQIDEIALIRPVREGDSLAAFERDVDRLASLQTQSPLSFGGGIRELACVNAFERLPMERVLLSSAFVGGDAELLQSLQQRLGRQALQALLPLRRSDQALEVYHCAEGRFVPLSMLDRDLLEQFANEVVVYDCDHEGTPGGFDVSLSDALHLAPQRLILAGGLDQAGVKQAAAAGHAAVAIENRILQQEYHPRRYRHG